ncbi:hypothetical protein ACYTPF_06570 [Alteromonas sp. HB246098]
MNSYYGEVMKKNGESVFSVYCSEHSQSATFKHANIKRIALAKKAAKNSSEKLPKFRKR